MLITNNGKIEGIPHTSMVETGGIWDYLLVCRVSPEHSDEELTKLFNTDTVEDDSIGVKYCYTNFKRIAQDENYKYVWLSYTERVLADAEYAEALNLLGVQTYEESEVSADA